MLLSLEMMEEGYFIERGIQKKKKKRKRKNLRRPGGGEQVLTV